MQLPFAKLPTSGDAAGIRARGAQTGASAPKASDPKWKAALDFEAMFMGQLMKGMRNSISHDTLNAPSPARQMFTEMLDQKYAAQNSQSPSHQMPDAPERAKSGALKSLAAQIYRSMIRHEASTLLGQPNASADVLATATSPSLLGSSATKPAALSQAPVVPAIRLNPAVLNTLSESAGRKHGLPASLIRSVIQTESAGDTTAVSSAGAKGLMQLMDGTAKDLGVQDSFDPEANVDGGARYLKQLLRRFDGDISKTLAGYNAGPGAVEKHGGIPPFKETQNYVRTVLRRMSEYETVLGKSGD
jgi:soluble lytic murein transglycosylase-like protein